MVELNEQKTLSSVISRPSMQEEFTYKVHEEQRRIPQKNLSLKEPYFGVASFVEITFQYNASSSVKDIFKTTKSMKTLETSGSTGQQMQQ